MGLAGRLLAAALLVGAGVFAAQGSRGDRAAFGACGVLFICAVFIGSLRVVAHATEDALVVRMFPFHPFHIPYQDITSVKVMDPALRAAGLGYRYTGPGERALLTGGPALSVSYAAPGVVVDTFHPPRQLSFSTPEPEALAALIARHRDRPRSRR